MTSLDLSRKILMIDDDEIDRERVSRFLRRNDLDWSLFEAENLESALGLISKETFDCVLLDYSLPGQDGLEIMAHLKKMGLQSPVILLTGMGDEMLAVKAMRAGAADYLPKDRLTPDLVVHSIKNCLEITRLKNEKARALEKLGSQEARYRSIIETVSDIIFQVNADGKVVFVNNAVKCLGFKPRDLIGQSFFNLLDKSHRIGPVSRTNILTRRSGKRATRNMELELRPNPGKKNEIGEEGSVFIVDSFGLWVTPDQPGKNLSCAETLQRNSEFVGTLIVARNFLDRKRYERKLKHFNDELQRSNQDLEEFALNASHDLQEPVRKVFMFADRLQSFSDSLDPKAIHYIERIQNASHRIMEYIQELLKLSQVTTRDFEIKWTDTESIVREAWRELETGPKDSLETHNLPQLELDPRQFKQLAGKILENSLDFRKQGEPCRVKVTGEKETGGFWKICFADNGIGFQEEYAEKIFRPFERLQGISKESGPGMGLAICRKIVQRHGGDIWASSQPGKGTEIILQLKSELEHA